MDLNGWILTLELFFFFVLYLGWRMKQFDGAVLSAIRAYTKEVYK